MTTLPKNYTQTVEQITVSNFTFWYCCVPLLVTAAFRACNGYIIITYNSNACWFFVCKHNYQNNSHSLKTNVPQCYTWHHYVFNVSLLPIHSFFPFQITLNVISIFLGHQLSWNISQIFWCKNFTNLCQSSPPILKKSTFSIINVKISFTLQFSVLWHCVVW
jgi:hypothetical protein